MNILTQHTIKKTTLILCPPCSSCGVTMRLVLIEPDKLDHDAREFECASCTHTERLVVKYR